MTKNMIILTNKPSVKGFFFVSFFCMKKKTVMLSSGLVGHKVLFVIFTATKSSASKILQPRKNIIGKRRERENKWLPSRFYNGRVQQVQHSSHFLSLVAFSTLSFNFYSHKWNEFLLYISNHSISLLFSFGFFSLQPFFCISASICSVVMCIQFCMRSLFNLYLLVTDAPTTSKCSMNNIIFLHWLYFRARSAYFSTNTNLFLITANDRTNERTKKIESKKRKKAWHKMTTVCNVHSCHRGNTKSQEKVPEVSKEEIGTTKKTLTV